ncbi:hypothetical protein [Jatrophihabitans fulvus]
MSKMQTLTRKLRARRDAYEFNRALETASPSMRSELVAAAARANR